MLQRRKSRPAIRQQVSKAFSLTAPIGGLNARDSLAAMDPQDAVTLENFFPLPTSVQLRNGSVMWATGLPANVETLMPYNSASAQKLFAGSGTAIYDVTAQGAVGAAAVSALSNVRFQHLNVGTPGGQFLYAVNGVDLPLLYNGSLWQVVASTSTPQTISSITHVLTVATATTSSPHGLVTGNVITVVDAVADDYNGTFQITVTGASTFTYVMLSDPGGDASVVGTYTISPAITGVDPKLLIHVCLYKTRVFFVEKSSFRIWYLPVNSIGGAAASIDLSPLFKLGGYLMAMVTWTIDNVNGVQEYAAFISSEGEVLLYQGTDPSSADNWAIEAMFRIGRPVGRRCFVKVGSDVIVLCADGFFPLSKALLTDRSQQQDAVSNKIVNLVNNDVQMFGANFGWEATLYPIGNKLLVNVPQIEGSAQYQWVMNTITGAWCRFRGWNAGCFALLADSLYYGGNLGGTANSAYVAKCDTGFSDNGAAIQGEAKQAFTYLGAPGYQKQVTMVRPMIQTSGVMRAALGVDVDFSDAAPVSAPSFSGNGGTAWGTALWDTFLWGDASGIKKDWQTVSAVGDAMAVHMRVVNNKTALNWMATEWLFQTGIGVT